MDNSWDNSKTKKSIKPRGGRIYRGALSTAAILATCVLGFVAIWVLWFSENEAKILEVERERAKPDWIAAASIVEGLRSEEGAKGIFRENPRLSAHFKNEIDFLAFAARWRPSLEPLPKEMPRIAEKNFGYRHGFGLGQTILSYRMPKGHWVTFIGMAHTMLRPDN